MFAFDISAAVAGDIAAMQDLLAAALNYVKSPDINEAWPLNAGRVDIEISNLGPQFEVQIQETIPSGFEIIAAPHSSNVSDKRIDSAIGIYFGKLDPGEINIICADDMVNIVQLAAFIEIKYPTAKTDGIFPVFCGRCWL